MKANRSEARNHSTAAIDTPVLIELEDRRDPRSAYANLVLIDGRPVAARDISTSGLSILLKPSIETGDIVRVTLAGAAGSRDEVATTARVARIEPRADGFIVGLEFIE